VGFKILYVVLEPRLILAPNCSSRSLTLELLGVEVHNPAIKESRVVRIDSSRIAPGEITKIFRLDDRLSR